MNAEANGNGGRIRSLSDSTIGIIIARYVVPPIIAALVGLGTLVLHNIDAAIEQIRSDSKSDTSAMWSAIQRTTDGMNSTREAVEVLIEKFGNYQAAHSAENDRIKSELADHESRLRSIEHRDH